MSQNPFFFHSVAQAYHKFGSMMGATFSFIVIVSRIIGCELDLFLYRFVCSLLLHVFKCLSSIAFAFFPVSRLIGMFRQNVRKTEHSHGSHLYCERDKLLLWTVKNAHNRNVDEPKMLLVLTHEFGYHYFGAKLVNNAFHFSQHEEKTEQTIGLTFFLLFICTENAYGITSIRIIHTHTHTCVRQKFLNRSNTERAAIKIAVHSNNRWNA